MSGIFISYRRAGVSTTTYRLADELKRTFGSESIFLDVESIDPGLPFAEAIQKALNQCSVALVIMGPEWLNMADDNGNRRLNNPDDWVRQEVRLALESSTRVIPVLVHDARMPSADELPGDISGLASLHAFSIMNSQTHWSFDVERLQTKIGQIDKKLAKKLKTSSPNISGDQGYSHKAIWALVLGIFVLLAYAVEGGFGDISEASGAIVFTVIGIILGILGFKDIRQGLKKGKGVAIGGIGLSVFMMLLSFGEMADMDSYIEPLPQAEILEAPAVVNTLSTTNNQPQRPRYTNISGNWSSNIGTSYQITQNGNQISFAEFNVFGNQVGSGNGQVSGNQLTFNYYNNMLNTSGRGTGQLQGNTISVSFVDQFNNNSFFEMYRQ